MHKKGRSFNEIYLLDLFLFEIVFFLCGCPENFTRQFVLPQMHLQSDSIKELLNELISHYDRIALCHGQQLTVGSKLQRDLEFKSWEILS